MKSRTNWTKVKSLTENEIVAAARSDRDVPLLTATELKKFKRVQPPKKVEVKRIRVKLHLSQEQFAHCFGVSIRTVQEWEQHRRTPTATARNFLKVIELQPKAVLKALSSSRFC